MGDGIDFEDIVGSATGKRVTWDLPRAKTRGPLESLARACNNARPKAFCPHQDMGFASNGSGARGPMPRRISHGLALARRCIPWARRLSRISRFGKTLRKSLGGRDCPAF